MQIRLSSVLVDDQDRALRFYTEKLGFTKKIGRSSLFSFALLTLFPAPL
jgi:hypothetical protein